MKCSATETDIVHLFGIVLGRKPSPKSYFERNKGRPLGEIAARMAASPEFESKVISPILSGDSGEDRELSPDERTWLLSSAQLPSGYRALLAQQPTRHRAALALTARALEATSKQEQSVTEGVSRAFDALGLETVAKTVPLAANDRAQGSAKDRLGVAEANDIWTLISLGQNQNENAPYQKPVKLGELADRIAASKRLSDFVIPCLYRQADREQGGSVLPLIQALTAGLTDTSAPLSRVLRAAAMRDPDTRDAVELLISAAESRATVQRFMDAGQLGAAIVALGELGEKDDTAFTDLKQAADAAIEAAGDEEARSILASIVASREKAAGLVKHEICRTTKVIGPDEAADLLPSARADMLYFVLEQGVQVPELVQSAISAILLDGTILPVRCAASVDPDDPAHNTFDAEVSGLAAAGPSGLRAILRQWPDRETCEPDMFVPGLSTQACEPTAIPQAETPVILAVQGAEFDARGVRTLTVTPEQSLTEVLDSAQVCGSAPVIFIGAGISYAEDYVDIALGHFTRLGKPPILPLLTVHFDTSRREARISDDAAMGGDVAPFLWLPMSVVRAEVARGLERSIGEVSGSLLGTGQLARARDCAGVDQVVFGCSADGETHKRNAALISDYIDAWQQDLDREAPPLAPNLTSLQALKQEAVAGHAARAAIAKRIIAKIEEVLAVMHRVATGQLEPGGLDPFATDQGLDRLLDFCTQDQLAALLPALWANRRFCRGAAPKTLEWLMRLSRMSGLQREAANSLRFSAADVLENELYLVRDLSDFLAGVLPPNEVTALLIEFLRQKSGNLSTRNARRCADVLRLYGDWSSASGFLQVLQEKSAEEYELPAPIANRIGSALLRGARPSERRPADDMVISPEQRLSDADGLKRAVLAGNREETLQALCFNLAETADVRRVLDPLRALSVEAAALQLGAEELPYHRCDGDVEMAIMAVIFADLQTMTTLSASAILADDPEVALMLEAGLGNLAPLADRLEGLAGEIAVGPPAFPDSSERRIFKGYRSSGRAGAIPACGRVSVVMSTLNTGRSLLMESVNSILGQTHEDIEILLIDDGGGPEAAAAIAEAGELDPRIRVFTMPRNLGPYLCRNFALSLATGDYIAIQDADDVSHPERLAAQVRYFREDDRLQLITSNHLRIDPRGWPQFEHGFRLFGDGTMTSMFRRSVFDRLGGFQPVRSRGDVEYRERIRRMCGGDAIRHLDFPLVACHAGIETLSQRTAHAKGSFLQLFRRAVDEIRLHPSLVRGGRVPSIAIPAPLAV